jgi:acetyltransferase-like isoleucine patch superfamily enzyme
MTPGAFPPNRVADHSASAWQAYGRRVVGAARWLTVLRYDFLTGLLGPWPGGMGVWLRSRLYPLLLRRMSPSAYLAPNVVLRHPQNITLAEQTFIDSFVYLEGMSDHPQGGVEIGSGTYVHMFCVISAAYHGFVRIGRDCSINPGAQIIGLGGVTIGDNVLVAGQTMMIAFSHGFADREAPMRTQAHSARGIVVGSDVWIGAGVKILDGVTVGQGAVLGAGSVVTHDVPPYAIMAGVPARLLRYRGKPESQ